MWLWQLLFNGGGGHLANSGIQRQLSRTVGKQRQGDLYRRLSEVHLYLELSVGNVRAKPGQRRRDHDCRRGDGDVSLWSDNELHLCDSSAVLAERDWSQRCNDHDTRRVRQGSAGSEWRHDWGQDMGGFGLFAVRVFAAGQVAESVDAIRGQRVGKRLDDLRLRRAWKNFKCAAAGWSEHDNILLCRQSIESDGSGGQLEADDDGCAGESGDSGRTRSGESAERDADDFVHV